MINNLGIIGVGKLGICYAIVLAKAGYKVYIYDINISILDNIKNDTYNYNEPGLNVLISEFKSNIIFTFAILYFVLKWFLVLRFNHLPNYLVVWLFVPYLKHHRRQLFWELFNILGKLFFGWLGVNVIILTITEPIV